jgi:hypothetical protein
MPTSHRNRRASARCAQANPHTGRPAYWRFGTLTPQQLSERAAFESRARMGVLAPTAQVQP